MTFAGSGDNKQDGGFWGGCSSRPKPFDLPAKSSSLSRSSFAGMSRESLKLTLYLYLWYLAFYSINNVIKSIILREGCNKKIVPFSRLLLPRPRLHECLSQCWLLKIVIYSEQQPDSLKVCPSKKIFIMTKYWN